VSGLVIEFQFGLSWSGLSKFAGNVFGAPVALETLVAFFAESTFLGMWIFGWGRLSKGVHVTLIWLVTVTAYASAYWIMVANGFLQHPVGYEVRDGRAYLTDFGALLGNPNAVIAVGHIAAAALLTGGLFVAGISAFHLVRRAAERDFFSRSLRLGVMTAALVSFPVYVVGAMQYPVLGETQPMKLAALGPAEGTTALATQLAQQYGPGDYVPPAWIAHAQNTMLYLGYLMFIVAAVAALLVYRAWLRRHVPVAILVVAAVAYPVGEFVGGLIYGEAGPNAWLIYALCLVGLGALVLVSDHLMHWRRGAYLMVAMIPVPFVASIGGWLFREGGRQPWIVYGELAVRDALSPVSTASMVFSLVAFLAVLLTLMVVNWVLIVRFVRRGPAGTQLGASPAPLAKQPVPTF